MLHTILDHMFNLPLPWVEKLLRPVLVYLALVILVRIFGKRELAQLNPFDLIVLLSLSNTVQNAIIGDDNSVSGGIIGAVGLLAINWLVVNTLYRSPRLTRMFEGRAAVLVREGKIDKHAMEHERLTREELIDVIHRQGFEHMHDVGKVVLEPNGTFYVEPLEPSKADRQHEELVARLESLTREVATLRAQSSGSV